MLGKLIKYEFKATTRIILLFWLALLVVSVINYFLMPWTDTGQSIYGSTPLGQGDAMETVMTVMRSIVFIMYILFAAAAAVVPIVIVIMRFYKMLGDEGYLYFTLPVTTKQHIFSKLITAAIWGICSIILVGLSVLIVIGRHEVFTSIPKLWGEAVDFGIHPGIWLLCIAIMVVLYVISGILQVYTAISIGPHITSSRIGGSIIAYILVYIATQIISLIGSSILFAITFNDGFSSYSGAYSEISMINSVFFSYFALLLVMNLAITIPCFFITHHMLNKKLNLN
jgi:hypothetical protein